VRTLLICHEEDVLDRDGMARWLASFSTLAGTVVIRDRRTALRRRIRAERRRSGLTGLLDVFAFRLYTRLRFAAAERAFQVRLLADLRSRYAAADAPHLLVESPNEEAAARFIEGAAPDVIIARCKHILKPEVFSLARTGTFVFHPGVCPEYRNAHGCFWALVHDDPGRVGMTLLRVDAGIDTGPVFGHYSYAFDARGESTQVIQTRVVYENLDGLQARLLAIHEGAATPLDTTGRASAVWGQPRLTRYLAWRHRTIRARNRAISLLYHDVIEADRAEESGFPGGDAAVYKLTPEHFSEHLDALAGVLRRPPASARELAPASQLQLPVLITVDDGGSSSVRIAELLSDRGWRGHFLVTAGFIGQPGFVGTEEIRAIAALGHVVGSHSLTHPVPISGCDRGQLAFEWRESVARIADVLGAPVTVASIPGGFYSRPVAEEAAAAGITVLFRSEPTTRILEIDGCRVLGRYCAKRTTPAARMAALVRQRAWHRAGERALWDGKKLLKHAGGPLWLAARKRLLRGP
jgi:peptidoglycan/xylan/chitin deacetylase (PgdA/CDA1 family)/folate-dependent phosphoribosylglycinamide formyltransferase PurN